MPVRHGPERVARVDLDWVTSAAGRRVLVHWADSRPAWLWSPDPGQLIWRNHAARFFGAKLKKHGLKLGAEAVPIKGQIARLIRLGSPGRSSLARVQFLAGGKPVASTCTATPLQMPGGGTAVLLVGVDAIDPEILALPEAAESDDAPRALLPAGSEYLLVEPDGSIAEGTPYARAHHAQAFENEGLPEDDVAQAQLGDVTITIRRLTAGPRGHRLLLLEDDRVPAIESVRAEEGLSSLDADPRGAEARDADEPLLPMGLAPVPDQEHRAAASGEEPWAEPFEGKAQSLSSLFDRLAGNEELFGELSAADEHFLPPPARIEGSAAAETPTAGEQLAEIATTEHDGLPAPDAIGAIIEFDDDLENDRKRLFRVTGRGFTPAEEPASEPGEEESPVEDESRRNFSELRRILSDRVAAAAPPSNEPVIIDPPIEPVQQPAAVSEGALINIAAETFILNRLPLGIMVFRDQQVLFANRAFTDLAGYETIDSLRNAGLKAIFPGEDADSAGPVTHLKRRDGTSFPVTARLQSITWQGRPALMLSASSAEPRPSHEGAVRAFAELLAELREEGFIAADRAGRIVTLSVAAFAMLRRDDVTGEPLSGVVHEADLPALRTFLEAPARFAETTRPSVALRARLEGVTIMLFAEGQAGIVSGYFGFIQRRQAAADQSADTDVDPSMLVRVSRGVRRPLNTIIGFADLIRSAAFGTIENHRYLEYARDIKTAGQEIAVLVDELDDYSRLRAGNYATRPADLDLGGLLDSCLLRVRGQAGAARVLVRSAVSERLPRVRADRASLGQAVLNLLASAIDQSPPGGTVILSAQLEDEGSVVVNIRDSGAPTADPGERFVVFRDGVGKEGEALAPVRSSVGLALTRSLIAVNACTLTVAPAGGVGTLFSLTIPADLIASAQSA